MAHPVRMMDKSSRGFPLALPQEFRSAPLPHLDVPKGDAASTG